MTTPHSALRAARMSLLMSQDDFARALRLVGVPSATKRLVQRWESGTTAAPRPLYARALEQVTGRPIEALGFAAMVMARVPGSSTHNPESAGREAGGLTPPGSQAGAQRGPTPLSDNYSGIWLSRYEYFSTGRDQTLSSSHHVVLVQHENRITVRSLPGSADSQLSIDLELDGSVLTGTWSELTGTSSYYRGARYHGAIQLLAGPTGRRMTGKWVGFGKDFEVNTGPWELALQDASTSKAAIERYDRPPDVG